MTLRTVCSASVCSRAEGSSFTTTDTASLGAVGPPSATAFTIDFVPVPMMHGILPTTGWRFGRFAYLTDLSFLPPSSFDRIKDIEVLIIDGLRTKPHETHFNFDQALETAKKTSATQIYLTHFCHDYTHKEIKQLLKEKKKNYGRLADCIVEPAYDGLSIEL